MWDESLKFTGEIRNNKYAYKSEKTGKIHWLEHVVEDVTSQKIGTEIDPMTFGVPPEEVRKKQESDYHKRRYQMIKDGTWTGSMKNEKK